MYHLFFFLLIVSPLFSQDTLSLELEKAAYQTTLLQRSLKREPAKPIEWSVKDLSFKETFFEARVLYQKVNDLLAEKGTYRLSNPTFNSNTYTEENLLVLLIGINEGLAHLITSYKIKPTPFSPQEGAPLTLQDLFDQL